METRTLEALAILRHLRWGYVRKSLQWLIVGVGITAIEPHAAVWFGDTVGWATGWVGWAVIMWSVLPFCVAVFRSDAWLLGDFKWQTGYLDANDSTRANKEVLAMLDRLEAARAEFWRELNLRHQPAGHLWALFNDSGVSIIDLRNVLNYGAPSRAALAEAAKMVERIDHAMREAWG
jgi:hypothetical protein